MSKYYLKINYLLIPIKGKLTKDYSGIRKTALNEFDYVKNIEPKYNALNPHHLHITSDRYPKKGDYITNGKGVLKCLTDNKPFENTWKIEASTDESLGLPKIPLEFQKTICEFYGNMPDCYIKFSSGGYANAMHMDSGQPPEPEVVFTNSNNEVIFVAPCDFFKVADAAENFAMARVKHIKNPVEKFMKELEFQSAFIAGADFWRNNI